MAMRSNGLHVTDVRGVTMNLRSRMMQLSADTRVNFWRRRSMPR